MAGYAMAFTHAVNAPGLCAREEYPGVRRSACSRKRLHVVHIVSGTTPSLNVCPRLHSWVTVNGINPDGVVRGSGIFAGGWGAKRASVYGVPEEELGAY